MAIPDYQTVMLPLLKSLSNGAEQSMKELTNRLAEQFALSEGEREEMLPSGQQTKFANRVGWAKSYMNKAGLVETVRRGVVRITKEGGKVLAENPAGIDVKYLKRYPSFVEFRNTSKEAKHTDANGEDESETPEEQLDTAYKKLRAALVDDLLSQVKQSSPAFFERLVVELLVAMGYGGSIEDAGKAVGRTGDGGIDGIIKEDRLGLDAVVVQAKRWDTNVVGRPDVQAFAGSMEPHRARKGVFITTSSFSSQAEEYVRQIERKIVLIDGPTLASYMIDYGVGVTTYRTFVLKKVDSDYFEELDR